MGEGNYTASDLFENWSGSFSVYELFKHKDGTEDLKILAANRAFVELIGDSYNSIVGKFFTDACPMALDWLPLYIETAKTGEGKLHESYNEYLQKYLSAVVFSPKIGQVALIIIDRTDIWNADQMLRVREKDVSALFSSMTTGFCMGRIIRDEQGLPIDAVFEMVNAAFELLEGFATASLQGKKLTEIRMGDSYFSQYMDVVEHKSKITFQKYIALNDFTLEVICFSQLDDIFVCIESNISERVKAEQALRNAHIMIEKQNQTILSSIDYASKIQENLLPRSSIFEKAFSDYSILWKPRDIVGGDIYWIKEFTEGTILAVCDCTGHGTPGALLTMLVSSTFDTMVNEGNYKNVSELMLKLDQRIATALNVHTAESTEKESLTRIHDGCDIAILFVAKDGTVTFSSAGIPVFVCNGSAVKQFKGQRLHIGDGLLTSPDEISVTEILSDTSNKFYIASDGLFDQIGGELSHPFGYREFKKIILQNDGDKQAAISEKVWEAFEAYRGKQPRRDDVELITFKP